MERQTARDISSMHIERHKELQSCEFSIPLNEFYYHNQARDLSLEFKILKRITETKKHADLLVENIGDNLTLNRYPDILPYRDTLILPFDGKYINASLINGIGEENKAMFIATQGPTESSLNSFWQLVWDYNVPLIIMGCNFIENEVDKCFQYFPIDENIKSENFEIIMLKSQNKLQNLIERVLIINHIPSETSKNVLHIQCTAWPDSSVPSITEEYNNINYIITKIEKTWTQTQGKIIAHCSAGVGRTGLILAIFNTISEMKLFGSSSIFKNVRLLREQRWGMVANEEQYAFIYKFIEYWSTWYLYNTNS